MSVSRRLFSLLLRLYPVDFREEMGEAFLETWLDRSRTAIARGGRVALAGVWLRAMADSLRNGIAERIRPGVSWRRGGNWGRETELAARRLRRAPLFTLSMIATLTLGLAAFGVVSAVVDKVLLAPLPYHDSDDLYFVWRNYTWIEFERGWLGGTDVVELATKTDVIEKAVGIRIEDVTFARQRGGSPEELALMVSSPGLFETLGASPMLGRGFAAGEYGEGRPPVVVLGHDLWQTRFAGDSSVIGSEVLLDGEAFTVIGVMPREFRFAQHSSEGPTRQADLYATFELDLATTNPGAGSYSGLIRARRGVSPEQVTAAVEAAGTIIDERDMRGRGLRLYPVSLREDLVAPVRPALIVLGSAGVILVLVLMVNLATLLLVRAAQREREFAIARALGANPFAVFQATLLEGALLGFLGGVCAAVVARQATKLLLKLAPLDLPRLDTIVFDLRLAAIVVAAGTLAGLLAGAIPAFWSARTSLGAVLGNAAVRGGGGGHGRAWRAMVVVQVALSLVLLSSGALLVRSFEGLLRSDPGFEPEGVLTFRIPISSQHYSEDTELVPLQERIRSELAAIPGVETVGAMSALPLTAQTDQTSIAFPGSPVNTGDADRDRPLIDVITTRPGALDALGIEIVSGREMRATPAPPDPLPDAAEAAAPQGAAATQEAAAPQVAREAMIDRTLEARFFPGGSALGATIPFGEETLTVVGVVEHARMFTLHEDGRGQLYRPNDDYTYDTLMWALESGRAPAGLIADVRAALQRVNPGLAIADVRTMEEIVRGSVREQRLSAVLIGAFSLGALLLAAMGLVGIISAAVTRRRHELAVRLALGADSRGLLRLVLRQGATLIALGLLLGVPGILIAGESLGKILIGVSPFDPLTLAAVAAGLALIALGACWLPARRVTRIQPAHALRQE